MCCSSHAIDLLARVWSTHGTKLFCVADMATTEVTCSSEPHLLPGDDWTRDSAGSHQVPAQKKILHLPAGYGPLDRKNIIMMSTANVGLQGTTWEQNRSKSYSSYYSSW